MLSNRRVICNDFLLACIDGLHFFLSPRSALFEESNLNVCCSIIFCCSKCAHIWKLNTLLFALFFSSFISFRLSQNKQQRVEHRVKCNDKKKK